MLRYIACCWSMLPVKSGRGNDLEKVDRLRSRNGQFQVGDFRYMASMAPSRENRIMHQSLFAELKRAALPIEDIVSDILTAATSNDDFVYGWMQFLLTDQDSRSSFDAETLLHIAVIGDVRIADLLDTLFAAGRVRAPDLADALGLLGAMCLFRGETANCRYLWSRSGKVRKSAGGAEPTQGDQANSRRLPTGKSRLEELEDSAGLPYTPCTLLVQALRIFTQSVDGTRCEDRHIVHLRAALESAVDRAMLLVTSARDCFDVLNELATAWYFCTAGCDGSVMRFLRFCHERIWLWDGLTIDVDPECIINIVLDLSYSHNGHRRQCPECDKRCEQFTMMLLKTKVDLVKLAAANVDVETLGRLLLKIIKLHAADGRHRSRYEAIARVLLDKGACFWSDWTVPILRVTLAQRRQHPIAKLILESLLPLPSHYHAIVPVR